ncbi:MAG: glycosyltransferase family 39 protein [Bacteroidota bacterium]|nr:glycosyltransferase family 39 protein [Bacteroidota bacterium]
MHALVAKNLSKNFLKPHLYPKEVLPYDFRGWTQNYIWVHKQPFFLWQMALSIKVFGANIFAVRLPSALCFTFATYCVYKIGKNIVNAPIGFYAAVLFSMSFYFGELCTGSLSTDHNDIVFISYVTASVWAFSEYIVNPGKRRWVIMIGIFSGIAILNKWLVGLLIFSGWFTHILLTTEKGKLFNIRTYKDIFLGLIVAIIVFAPWQIFCLLNFPEETKYEMTFNSKHLFEPIEGHGGDAYFYFNNLYLTYGRFSPLFIVLGLSLLYSYFKDKRHFISCMTMFVVCYTFYTLVATKMNGFTMIVSFFVYLGFGAIIYRVYSLIKKKLIADVAVVLIVFTSGILILRIEEKQASHSDWKANSVAYYNRKNQIYWKDLCLNLNKFLPNEKYVLFNCPEMQEHKLMFHTNYIGYWGVPNDQQAATVRSKGLGVAVYNDGNIDVSGLKSKGYIIVTDAAHEIIKSDTFKIIKYGLNPLSIEADGRVTCNNNNPGVNFIVNQYKDGTCSMKSAERGYLTYGVNLYGELFGFKSRLDYSERFYLEKNTGDFYKIKTLDGEYVKIINGGVNIISNKDENNKDDLFEFKKVTI